MKGTFNPEYVPKFKRKISNLKQIVHMAAQAMGLPEGRAPQRWDEIDPEEDAFQRYLPEGFLESPVQSELADGITRDGAVTDNWEDLP